MKKNLAILFLICFTFGYGANIDYSQSSFDFGYHLDKDKDFRFSWHIMFQNIEEGDEKKDLFETYQNKIHYGFGIGSFDNKRTYYGKLSYALPLESKESVNFVGVNLGINKDGNLYSGAYYTYWKKYYNITAGVDYINNNDNGEYKAYLSVGVESMLALVTPFAVISAPIWYGAK